jgi:hypothetical protein
MDMANRVYTKRARPDHTGQMIGVRLQPDQIAALDRWIAANGATLTRPAAIRAILEKAIA